MLVLKKQWAASYAAHFIIIQSIFSYLLRSFSIKNKAVLTNVPIKFSCCIVKFGGAGLKLTVKVLRLVSIGGDLFSLVSTNFFFLSLSVYKDPESNLFSKIYA